MKLKEIFNRYSVRAYKNMEVTRDKTESLLKAAMQAPSAANQQSLEYIVVENSDAHFKLSKVSQYAGFIKNAPLLIIVLGNKNKMLLEDFWIQDASAACENILLEAVHLGLGGVWIGIAPDEEKMQFIRDMYKLPESVLPAAIISIGYPKTEAEVKSKYDPDKVHYDGYIK